MKNTINNLFLAIFLALISQGIQAQFDDVYYDPDQRESTKEIKKHPQKETYTKDQNNQTSSNDSEYAYDDENTEWANQDYYYTSRIKRFHRPYYGFDYYNSCYVDNYYYDPFDFNPSYYNRDIYVSSYGYRDYYRWRTWHLNPFFSYSYWNQWDYTWGWSPYPLSFGYNYWPYSGYYNNYWCNNSYYPYYGGGNYYGYNNYDNHPNGTYYGSRKFGLSNSSNRGPVRVNTPSPRVFTEAHGNSYTPSPDRGNSRRVIRSADGDDYRPGPVSKPDRQTERPKYNPREIPGEKSTPRESRPEPRREYKPDPRERRSEQNKTEFRPERIHRDEPRVERPRESSPRPQQESRPEPRMERRQESYHSTRSESSGSRSESHSSSFGNRGSHR